MTHDLSILIPITTFILGWGSGVITAWTMYRDHERRIQNTETVIAHVAQEISKNTQDIAVLYAKLRSSEG